MKRKLLDRLGNLGGDCLPSVESSGTRRGLLTPDDRMSLNILRGPMGIWLHEDY
jgi:hypothetical protein